MNVSTFVFIVLLVCIIYFSKGWQKLTSKSHLFIRREKIQKWQKICLNFPPLIIIHTKMEYCFQITGKVWLMNKYWADILDIAQLFADTNNLCLCPPTNSKYESVVGKRSGFFLNFKFWESGKNWNFVFLKSHNFKEHLSFSSSM